MTRPPIHHPAAIVAAWARIEAPDTPDDILEIACRFVAATARDARADTARDILALFDLDTPPDTGPATAGRAGPPAPSATTHDTPPARAAEIGCVQTGGPSGPIAQGPIRHHPGRCATVAAGGFFVAGRPIPSFRKERPNA